MPGTRNISGSIHFQNVYIIPRRKLIVEANFKKNGAISERLENVPYKPYMPSNEKFKTYVVTYSKSLCHDLWLSEHVTCLYSLIGLKISDLEDSSPLFWRHSKVGLQKKGVPTSSIFRRGNPLRQPNHDPVTPCFSFANANSSYEFTRKVIDLDSISRLARGILCKFWLYCNKWFTSEKSNTECWNHD